MQWFQSHIIATTKELDLTGYSLSLGWTGSLLSNMSGHFTSYLIPTHKHGSSMYIILIVLSWFSAQMTKYEFFSRQKASGYAPEVLSRNPIWARVSNFSSDQWPSEFQRFPVTYRSHQLAILQDFLMLRSLHSCKQHRPPATQSVSTSSPPAFLTIADILW